ncbi:MAG: DNA-directed RNA polymerase subunit beta', partial [Mycoplasmataceae bacterium]|nr:DNA-directed RNA polymerase subunit beta' [Mycoplasmataceae bacterium]
EEQDNKIWPFVEKAIEGKVVLLNRAPTLHRLSIQAFEPVLVRGRAIKLHPLATTAFNADFDGDQMAVHVPISPTAIREAKELMLASKNILGPKDGEPIINPSQDMILGIYYLTDEKKGAKGEGNFYGSLNEMYKAYELGLIDIHARIAIPAKNVGKSDWIDEKGYAISTVGKFIFNEAFPTNFPFIFDESRGTLAKGYKKFIAPSGTDLGKFVAKLSLNDALGKKQIAKVVRKVFDKYVAEITKEDLAQIVKKTNSKNYKDTVMEFHKMEDHLGQPLNKVHSQILSNSLRDNYARIQKSLALANEGVSRVFEIKERVELLEAVWFDYTNVVAGVLDNIKDLGFKYSMLSGVTMSISDIKSSGNKEEQVNEGEKYVADLKNMYDQGLLTDDERYQLSIKKWAEVKNNIQDNLKEIAETPDYNPIFMMMKSGARGNISNFTQLAGLRGLMANNKKQNKALTQNNIIVRSTVEVPVKSSFLEGLTGYEFYSSTHGARKGLTDTALNTANSGYLTRRLVDVAQNIVVREADCGSDHGFTIKDIIDTKTNSVIVPFAERIEGRFTNTPVVNPKTKKEMYGSNILITPEMSEEIDAAGVKELNVRSVLGCQTENGVCKLCYGKDLATNRIVQIGEAVGIVAAQSIGEPGTQLTMRTFHTGGVAGAQDITQGFDRLKQLIDATKKTWEKPAIISKTSGKVVSIKPDEEEKNKTVITVKANDESEMEYEYQFFSSRRLRVKKGDDVIPGKKLVEGPILLENLLEVAGPRAVQNYLLKEIQRLYRLQGISISDKYIEVIIRQMLSKILIQDPGDSALFAGSLIDINVFKKVNKALLVKGKKPAYGTIVIKGAKQTPLLAESFLA